MNSKEDEINELRNQQLDNLKLISNKIFIVKGKMTPAEAQEIIAWQKLHQQDSTKHIQFDEAYGFLEGYNSKEALQRKEVLDLVEALEKIIKFNDRAGVASWADEALSQYREATKP